VNARIPFATVDEGSIERNRAILPEPCGSEALSGMSVIAKLFNALSAFHRAFAHDRSGAIAIIFAITLLPILGVIALALDYGRASDAELTIQRAADSAVLSAQRVSPAPKEKLRQVFRDTLNANLPEKYREATHEIRFKPDMSSMSAVVTYTMPTAFMVALGKPTFTVAIQTGAKLRVLPAGIPLARGRPKPPGRALPSQPLNPDAARLRQLLRDKIEEARQRAPANPQVERMLDALSKQLGR
jgi:Flp pilus assembly protein TadG